MGLGHEKRMLVIGMSVPETEISEHPFSAV